MCRDDDVVDNVTDADILRWDREKDERDRPKNGAKWLRKKLDEITAERDELAAEIERVKAERDSWKATGKEYIGQRNNFLSKLAELKSRLPVNRDGDVVLWGDTQFVPVGDKPVAVEFTVEVLGVDSFGNWYSMMSGEKVYLAGCHSTAESCAAHEGKEGENDECK